MREYRRRREQLRLFSSRRYLCHLCGRHGRQGRRTDPAPSSPRFRILPDTLLLPYCGACAPSTPEGRDDAEFTAAHAVLGNHVPGADPVPLDPLLCSVAGCARPWHDLGVPPPFVTFYDADAMLYRHPCPWCVAESPAGVGRAHARTVEALADPGRRLAATVQAWLDSAADPQGGGPV